MVRLMQRPGYMRSMHSTRVPVDVTAKLKLWVRPSQTFRRPTPQKNPLLEFLRLLVDLVCSRHPCPLSGGEGPSLAVPDARDHLTSAAQASAFSQELGSGIDYLIGCEARH